MCCQRAPRKNIQGSTRDTSLVYHSPVHEGKFLMLIASQASFHFKKYTQGWEIKNGGETKTAFFDVSTLITDLIPNHRFHHVESFPCWQDESEF